MSIDFKVPELGENIASGDIVEILVREGESVAAGQNVVALETDKAVVEIPCSEAGKVQKIHVKKGDRVKVGQTILSLEAAAAESGQPVSPTEKPAVASAQADEPAIATGTPEAKSAAKPAGRAAGAGPAGQAAGSPRAAGGPIPAGPAVRRSAREQGVDLAAVVGSGRHGRITPEDVAAAAAGGRPQKSKPAAATLQWEPVVPPGEAAADNWGPTRRDRLSQIRMAIAAHMVKSASTIPHVTNFDDADITELEGLRKSVPAGLLGANVKLTAAAFVCKAVAIALRRHPMLNASLDEAAGEVVYKQYVHLGVAVDTPRGLVVPVMRDVDKMNLPEVARGLASLADRARGAQFSLEDLRGGTFTISNMGAVGGTYSTPIINHPEVAVLLVGRARQLPCVRGERIEPRWMMPLSLSYDHRLVDGATAARFLNDVIGYLQAPATLLLL